MYTFSSRLKTFSIILMVLGVLGMGYSFFTAPKTVQDVQQINAEHHAEGHEAEAKHAEEPAAAHPAVTGVEKTEAHGGQMVTDDKEHSPLEHELTQLQNKPWSAVYVGAIFFMLIALGAFAFYCIQNAAQAGWSPLLFRVMEGISSYLLPGSVIFFILLLCSVFGFNKMFVWMTPEAAHDHIIHAKSGYLNIPFFLIRAVVFLGGWNIFRLVSRKYSLRQDDASDNLWYKKNFKLSAAFLVFFIVTESIMSWDWIMSIDAHWFSTLFGWYVFASFIVSAVTVIAMVTIYMKSRGYLEYVNTSHLHDLAKFMFGFSIFWTYLWFSQFMLIWYADMPEEITYFVMRIDHYTIPFWGMLIMNFVFPVLILVNSDFKRLPWIIVIAGLVILTGHYIDFYNMIMPGTVGEHWFIGAGELGALCFFGGLFIFVTFTAIAKAPLLAKRNPYIEESKHFHY